MMNMNKNKKALENNSKAFLFLYYNLNYNVWNPDCTIDSFPPTLVIVILLTNL